MLAKKMEAQKLLNAKKAVAVKKPVIKAAIKPVVKKPVVKPVIKA
jgi:hypothetical protein